MSDSRSGSFDAPARRVVVTGAAGFIGSALVRHFVSRGLEVAAVDLSPVTIPGARFVAADLSLAGALDSLVDGDTVLFHFAASADVAASVRNPRADFTNTFRALFEILEVARTTGCQVIYPSTASVYDTSDALPLAERSFPRPTSPYAAGKLAGEAYCFAYARSFGIDVRVARLFSVYGVGMRRFAIHDIIRKIQLNKDEVSILGDGRQIRDYLYIDDAVRGLDLIARCGTGGEDYNLASGAPVSVLELTRLIGALMGVPNIRVRPTGESFPGDTPQWYADISKVSGLGFVPNVSLSDGLQRTIRWLQADADGRTAS